ncbi:hypothetical protein ANCDUO_08761 [Ancylostoma duodenale]|uniref:Uncharacterized protein n=1 Tax=Ancylostoma duodenale TaxID=51022 RepID=A0A0C2GV21_9BILA|nr:hypothetical protein ANCDUO_08761 [Ancylostoma duodenale]
MSFIDNTLAHELNLQILDEKQVKTYTFGSSEARVKKCNLVHINVWDAKGVPHSLELLINNIINKEFGTPNISEGDRIFIQSLNVLIHLSYEQRVVRPLILIGCDQMWEFIKLDANPVRLPSGLHLLPTLLGYLLTREKSQSQAMQISQFSIEEGQWDSYWSMEEGVLETQLSTIVAQEIEEEKDKWAKCWEIDAAGTEPFATTEHDERAMVDQHVWDQFNQSIERRPDGYYVPPPPVRTNTNSFLIIERSPLNA